jgi:hypothetical protein
MIPGTLRRILVSRRALHAFSEERCITISAYVQDGGAGSSPTAMTGGSTLPAWNDRTTESTARGPSLQRRNWKQASWRSAGGDTHENPRRESTGPDRKGGGRGRGRDAHRQRGGSSGSKSERDIVSTVFTTDRKAVSGDGAHKRSKMPHLAPVIVENAMNNDMLPMLPYIVSPAEASALAHNQMAPQDARLVSAKLRTALIKPISSMARAAEAAADDDARPNFQLESSLISRPSLQSEVDLGVDVSLLDSLKTDLQKFFGLSDEEFERHKKEALHEVKNEASHASNSLVQEAELEETVQAALPANSLHVSAVLAKIKVLQANPHWPHDRKMIFARRLLKTLG